MANEKSNHRLGTHGNITLRKDGCNSEIGKKGLEKLGDSQGIIEYVSGKNNTLDIELNIKTLGNMFQDGLDNTKEMAEKWNWHKDNHELNWRDTPCSLRISYNPTTSIFKIQVWNELIQTWARLSLTKDEILKIIEN